jgi:hypothetical protein
MPHLQPALPAPENEKESTGNEGLVNINLVLQNAIRQSCGEDRSNITLRCDELPFVPGTEAHYQTVFTGLLQMILQQRTASSSRLFLHIHCTPEETGTRNVKGLKWFSVQLHSNILPGADWVQANSECISEITDILGKNGGGLAVNGAPGPGCIFSLSLPGKNS